MGGSGGGPFSGRSPSELRSLVRKEEDKTKGTAFQTELAGTLNSLLGVFNSRDVEAVQERLDHLKAALQGTMEGSFDQLFGGSWPSTPMSTD
jgi:hypothetical protein